MSATLLPVMSTAPQESAELRGKLTSFDTQTRAIGAGELGLVALAFSDLTSTIAQRPGMWHWLVGLFVTATLLAGACTAVTWIYTHQALNVLQASQRAVPPADVARVSAWYAMARVLGWCSIMLVLLAGAAYTTAVWKWVQLAG